MCARSFTDSAVKKEEREARGWKRDNLATKGFTARNHRSEYGNSNFTSTCYWPGRLAVMKLQPPLCSRANFFSRWKMWVEGKFSGFQWVLSSGRTTTLISFRREGTQGLGEAYMGYIYRLPTDTWRGWLRPVKLTISVISVRRKFCYSLLKIAPISLPFISDYALKLYFTYCCL